MRHQPDLNTFLDLAKTHRLVPVYRQLVGDTLTPVIAFRKIQDGDWSFLFESVIGGERLGRYSFLGSARFLFTRPGATTSRSRNRLIAASRRLMPIRFETLKRH
jgi:hypothetical protein